MEIVNSDLREQVLNETTDAVRKLIVDLQNRISELSDGQSLYIIALARKMPRFIQRILRHLNDTGDYKSVEAWEEIMGDKRVIFITEHAIPFVFKGIDSKKAEVLVLDDVVVTGNTLRAVTGNIKFLTGKNADVWTLYYYNSAIRPLYIKNLTIGSGLKLPLPVIKKKINAICSLIAESELPVDLEFPILHLSTTDSSAIDTFESELESKFSKESIYTLPDSGIIPVSQDYLPLSSYNILLYSNLSDARRNDFAKVRCFKDIESKEIRVVPFVPLIIREQDLDDDKLFTTLLYEKIWEMVNSNIIQPGTIKIGDDIESAVQSRGYEESFYLTKTIIANWLYSLSTFIKYFYDDSTKSYKGFGGNLPEVKEAELTLIAGEKLAKEIIEIVKEILTKGVTENIYEYSTIISILLSSPDKEQEFIGKMINKISNSSNLYDALTETFGLAKTIREADLENMGIVNDNKSNGILARALRYFLQFPYMNHQLEPNIHKWLDAAIDLGLVIPKYKPTKDNSGVKCWSIYYFASHII